MILVTNGCSFTTGAPLEHGQPYEYKFDTKINDYVFPTAVMKHAWPHLIPSDKTYNLAVNGSGNHRILRTTLDFIHNVSDEILNDCVFVICWSTCARTEYWYNNIPYSIDVYDEPGSAYPTENDGQHAPVENPEEEKVFRMAAWNAKVFASNKEKELYETLIAMVTLAKVFESRGLKYLYTSMQWNSTGLPEEYIHNNWHTYQRVGCHNELLDLFDKDKNSKILTSVNRYLYDIATPEEREQQHYYLDDGHPNAEGNAVFAEYIIKELEKIK